MKKLKTFESENIIFLLVILIAVCSTSDKTNGNVPLKPPQMWITPYRTEQLIADPIKLGHTTDYVFESNLFPADLTCEAEYPIALKFPHPEDALAISQYSDVSNYRISNWTNQSMTPLTTKFMWVMEIPIPRVSFLSVNITCAPVDRNLKISETSVHIYWKGEESIEHQGKTLHISANPSNNSPLVLPCRPANPNLRVVLEKRDVNENTEKQVWKLFNTSSNHVTFDRKIGFTFQKDAVDKHIFGLYRCSIVEDAQNNNQVPCVILNVTESTSSSIASNINLVPRSILAGNASAGVESYDRYYGWLFKCCSGIHDKPPRMYFVMSSNPVGAQVVRSTILSDIDAKIRHPLDESLRRDDCYKAYALTEYVAVSLICQGENIDFVEEYTNVFRPSVIDFATNKSDRTMKDKVLFNNAENFAQFQKPEISTNQFLRTADLKTAPVSQKITLTLLGNITEDPYQLTEFSHALCDKRFNSTSTRLYNNFIGELLEYDRDVYKEGEKMILMCLGVKMLYAHGGYLRLNWKNGTTSLVKPMVRDVYYQYNTMECGQVYQSKNTRIGYADSTAVSKFGTVLAYPGMVSVECWMPRGDGTGWNKISKKLTIVPNISPKFAEAKNEVVFFSDGEKWKFLICTVTQGYPLPTLNVTKDGLPFKTDITHNKKFQAELLEENDIVFVSYRKNTYNDKSLTVLMILPEIKSYHQGVYQCTASNIKKTVMRTMKVTVRGGDQTSTTSTNDACTSPDIPYH